MRDLFFCILTALIVVVHCETIHFTNSPSHLVGSKNITSYKLLVKNSDPITIIEANKEVAERPHNKYIEPHIFSHNPNDRIDLNVDDSGDQSNFDYHVKLLANMAGSHQIDSAPTQNVHGTVGLTITGGPSDAPIPASYDSKKSELDNEGEASNISAKKVVYSPVLLKKFMKEYNEKLKNADVSTKNAIQKIHEKIYEQQQTPNENIHDKPDIPLEFDKSIEEMEQKYNLNGYNANYNDDRRKRPADPYKDRDGWVTLEAVPWSSSSVSKWYPHGGEEDTRRRPSHSSTRPYGKPDKFPYHDDLDDDYYNRPKPSYVDRDRPNVYSTWTKPQSLNGNGRPRPQPYRFSEPSFGANKFYDRDSHSNRPWNSGGEIITDNRPSEFPSESHGNRPSYHDDFNTASSNHHSSYQERPSESNGEWVLISTTKGYQVAAGNRRQQGKRALDSSDAQSSVIVKVPRSTRMHKSLKLTVLPAEDPAKNSTFSSSSKKKQTTTIHGGMVEIDATHQSIEDDVRATFLAQKKLTATVNVNDPKKTSSTPSSTVNKTRKLLKGNFKLEERSA